jgi:hypothetical protein
MQLTVKKQANQRWGVFDKNNKRHGNEHYSKREAEICKNMELGKFKLFEEVKKIDTDFRVSPNI